MIHTYFRFEIIKPVIDQKPALIEYKPALMPKQSWSHEALLHQDHKGPRAIMECDSLAVLSGLRIDAAGLIYLVRFDGVSPIEREIGPKNRNGEVSRQCWTGDSPT